jgi:hypothetical protein
LGPSHADPPLSPEARERIRQALRRESI